ncbi:olfactory receptor 1F12-like [Austrofundulus limnaeus]|uniref:Olfactory receptor n=1 Tax=Austrofundulus limnaeus TaxID=52670 RepID=A0A2I4D7Q8_AUSLI|nr:PREDICTED: olfactory receptor 1F12-like [Austrofundulus limnaeus]
MSDDMLNQEGSQRMKVISGGRSPGRLFMQAGCQAVCLQNSTGPVVREGGHSLVTTCTGLFPFLLIQILSDVHTISAPLCFLQIYCLYSHVAAEFYNLTILSYDRYLAICFPLQYNSVMTMKKVGALVAAAWIAAFLVVLITVSLSWTLQLCDNIIHKVYCDNYSIVKLACSDITFNNIYGLLTATVFVYVPFTLIFYTYMKIFKVCFSGSKQTRQKTVSTCTPHLASLINFLSGVWFEVLQSRLNMNSVPNIVRIILSLYFLTCPPLFNPLIYGLKLSKIHNLWKSLLYIRWR